DIKYDSATNLITIRVLYPNMDKANDIANFVVKKFKLIKEKYDYFNDYEIQTTETMLTKVNGDEISLSQNNRITDYKNQYKAITDRKSELSKLKEPNPPKMESISRKNEAKNAMLAGVGVFLIVWIIYLILRYLHMSSKGVLVTASDLCKASMLYALADFTNSDKEYAYERLQAFIPLVAKESKKIMFLGKVDDTMIQELVNITKKSMNDYSIKGGVDIEKNSAVLKDTIDSDVVVLVMQREYTLFRDIKRQQKILKDLGKKVIGCVVC
ncbi:MAG: hypothetical protein PUG10_05310, partial [Lachnospiraceae bacterium]|nr:hypothetical protein [Lachnospiraceae bacterium]